MILRFLVFFLLVSSTLHASDEFVDDSYVECGSEVEGTTLPSFKLHYINLPDFHIAEFFADYTTHDFTSSHVLFSITQSCEAKYLQSNGPEFKLVDPKNKCVVIITPSGNSTYQVKFEDKMVLDNCVFTGSKNDLIHFLSN